MKNVFFLMMLITIVSISSISTNSESYSYNNIVDYSTETDGEITILHPNMLIDSLSFTSLSGEPTLIELGRTKTEEYSFITAFVIDTSNTNFSSGEFTKRAEGKELYFCSEWNDGCLTGWSYVQDLSGEEYTHEIQAGKVAYGETVLGKIGIASVHSPSGSLYIQGAAISPTQADGFLAYGELNIATPRYRIWNSSNNFSSEQNARSLGVDGTDDITWVVTKGNHQYDQIIMGTEDKSNDVNIQVYHSNNSWTNLLEVGADVFNSNSRGFDLAVEDVSGEVLIAYENSSALANSDLEYRIWNGSLYSAPQLLRAPLANSPIRWVKIFPRAGSDDIMLLVHNNAGDLHAFYWDGNQFGTTANLTLSLTTASSVDEHFGFAWEGTSDDGLVVYGTGTDLVYRTFSITAPYWSTEATIALGKALASARLCTDQSSDYIGIIVQDGGADVNVRMWDGTQILASPPTEELTTEPKGANNANADCVWHNSSTAVFGFVDSTALAISYTTFTKTNTWGTTDLNTPSITPNFASDDIHSLRFTSHPTTSEFMAISMDLLEDVTAIRWNGTNFTGIGESPLEINTEVLNGDQEGAMFDWFRYDPVPNVTSISPNNLNIN